MGDDQKSAMSGILPWLIIGFPVAAGAAVVFGLLAWLVLRERYRRAQFITIAGVFAVIAAIGFYQNAAAIAFMLEGGDHLVPEQNAHRMVLIGCAALVGASVVIGSLAPKRLFLALALASLALGCAALLGISTRFGYR